MGAGCVVDALETPARQAVTVPGGAGVHVVVTLTGLTRPQWATFPKGVPKVALGAEFAAGTWKEQMDKSRGSSIGSETRLRGRKYSWRLQKLPPWAPEQQPQEQALPRGWLLLSSELDGGRSRLGAILPRLPLTNDLSFQTDISKVTPFSFFTLIHF